MADGIPVTPPVWVKDTQLVGKRIAIKYPAQGRVLV